MRDDRLCIYHILDCVRRIDRYCQVCLFAIRKSFTCERPAYYCRFFGDDSQVRACCESGWRPPCSHSYNSRLLMPLKNSACDISLLTNGLHVDRLRPNLLQFDFAAVVSKY